jgi:hypothetical protein
MRYGIWVFVVVLVIGAVIVFVGNRNSAESAANSFMQALADKDVDTLVRLSYFDSPPSDLREQWDHCLNHAARNYVFVWNFVDIRYPLPKKAVVSVVFIEYTTPMGQENPEPVELPLIDTDHGWKVNMDEIPRKFFPYLPR